MIGCDDNYDQTDAYIRKLEAERDAALADVERLKAVLATWEDNHKPAKP